MTDQTYASMTKEPFLLSESVQLAQEVLDGASWADLTRSAREGRLFGNLRVASQVTMVTTIKTRLLGLPEEVLRTLAEGTLEVRQLLLLALILRQRLLLRTFLAEVLVPRLQVFERTITDVDVRAFLTGKAEQEGGVAEWSPTTLQKTRSTLTRLLTDAGVLKPAGTGTYELVPQYLPSQVSAAVMQVDPGLLQLLEALK